MQYWHSILDEVLNKHDDRHTFLYTSRGRLHEPLLEEALFDKPPKASKRGRPRKLRMYFLNPLYPTVYFTRREAECVFWLVQDKSVPETAENMHLSARTVEFYVKNLKLKLQCANRYQLIEKVLQTTLLQQLAEDGLCVVQH